MERTRGTGADLIHMEEEIRNYWRLDNIPEQVRSQHRGGPAQLIVQQPVPAIGNLTADMVRLFCYTDLLGRYRAKRGGAVSRLVGWSCHGLPVELAVEQSPGPDLDWRDLAQFTAACRQTALYGMRQGEAEAQWLGIWLDPAASRATLEPQVQSAVWGVLRRLFEAGRLRQELRICPVCPRCATPLSEAEAGRHSVEVETCSAWVRLPWEGEPNAYFLVWAPEPWMLTGMVALAARAESRYALVEPAEQTEGQPPMRLLLAEARLDGELAGSYRLVRRLRGKELRGARYRPAFTFIPSGPETGQVVSSSSVPLDQGTGLLPVTPAFDSRSLALAQALKLPISTPLDQWGYLDSALSHWRGVTPVEAEPHLVAELESRELLVRSRREPGRRRLCPHCGSVLVPNARPVWLVEAKSGPWIIGRDRAWGVPLPVWACEGCAEQVCIGSLDELASRADMGAAQIDPHLPAVSRLTLRCGRCGGAMRRIAPVVDAAFEEALLPWLDERTNDRGTVVVGLGKWAGAWLEQLGDMADLLNRLPVWERTVALPEAAAPVTWDASQSLPADAVRWAAYTGTTPGDAEKDFLRPLWSFVAALGDASTPQPGAALSRPSQVLLDRWMLARLHQSSRLITEALDADDPYHASTELAGLVDDILAWYVPLQGGERRQLLRALGRLSAPFVPHLAEAIHRAVADQSEPSIHLLGWPAAEASWESQELVAQMARVRRLARLGQKALAQAGAEPGLPGQQVRFGRVSRRGSEPTDLAPFGELLAAALWGTPVHLADLTTEAGWRLTLDREQVTPRAVTAELIDAALAGLDATDASRLAVDLWEGFSVSLPVAGQAITLLPGEVTAEVQAPPGYAAAVEAGWLALAKGAVQPAAEHRAGQ